MNTTNLVIGIVAIVAGILVIIFPLLVNFIVALALLAFGVWFVIVALTGRRVPI